MDTDTRQWLGIIVIMLIVLSIIGGTAFIVEKNMEPDVEEIRSKIKDHLYEEYGQEFVVERIGARSYEDGIRYEARIYPKSIVGTNKEGDDYYYAKAGLKKKSFGKLGKVGAGYETVQINIEAENYLMPKVKEIFGERVKLKPDVKYKKIREGEDYFVWQIVSGFKKLLKKTRQNPDKHRLLIDLEVYIFNKIEDKAEKEKRRKQVFRFVQYLKEKGLYEYLELGVAFIDERVLAPSYDEFERKVELSDKVEKKVMEKDETVKMPPIELRKQMSQELQKEINNLSGEKLLERMKNIKKEELSYDEIREYNGQYYCWIYSLGMLEENYSSSITEEDKERTHDKLKDIKLSKYKKYLYINQGGRK